MHIKIGDENLEVIRIYCPEARWASVHRFFTEGLYPGEVENYSYDATSQYLFLDIHTSYVGTDMVGVLVRSIEYIIADEAE